jgi:hypothetical protein
MERSCFCSCTELVAQDPRLALRCGACGSLDVCDLGDGTFLFAAAHASYVGDTAAPGFEPATAPRPSEAEAVFKTRRCWILLAGLPGGTSVQSGIRPFQRVWGSGGLALYEEQEDPLEKVIHEIKCRANDLEYGDEWDWMRGHEGYAGHGLAFAGRYLLRGLRDSKSELRLETGYGLLWLTQHVGHKCYSKADLAVLGWVLEEMQARLETEAEPEVAAKWKEVIVQASHHESLRRAGPRGTSKSARDLPSTGGRRRSKRKR